MDAGAGGVRIVSAVSARSVEDTKLNEAPPLPLSVFGQESDGRILPRAARKARVMWPRPRSERCQRSGTRRSPSYKGT